METKNESGKKENPKKEKEKQTNETPKMGQGATIINTKKTTTTTTAVTEFTEKEEEEEEEEEEEKEKEEKPKTIGGEEGMKKLIEGNKRFIQGKSKPKEHSKRRIETLVDGQHPFASVLTCSDSRVSPEFLFDVGIGEVFVVRTAGNVASGVSIGTLEYSIEHLKTPLLIILGHTDCGAIKAACKFITPPPPPPPPPQGDQHHQHQHQHQDEGGEEQREEEEEEKKKSKLMKLVEKVAIATKDVQGDLESAIIKNIKIQTDEILRSSKIISEFNEKGFIKIVEMIYDLKSGSIKII